MASYFLQVKPLFEKLQQTVYNKSIGFVRNNSTKPVQFRYHGKYRTLGFKKENLSSVRAGQLIYNQFKLDYNPGLNVGIGPIGQLYAKVTGKVVVTSEKTNYKLDEAIVKRSFPNYVPPYGMYINVIPEPLHRRFKLVEKF